MRDFEFPSVDYQGEKYPLFSQWSAGPTPTPLFRYLDTLGNGNGTKNLIENYAAASIYAHVAPAANEVYRINRMIIFILDNTQPSADNYGNITGGLATGIKAQLRQGDTVTTDLTDSEFVTANHDWNRVCYDAQQSGYNVGNNAVHARWSFFKSGFPLRLDGEQDEKFGLVINADVSGLVEHYFQVQGWIE